MNYHEKSITSYTKKRLLNLVTEGNVTPKHAHYARGIRFFFLYLVVIACVALTACGTGTTTSVTIEVPTDAQGRRLIGAGAVSTLTIRVQGRDRVTVKLDQRPTTVSDQGVVFFGDQGSNTNATVTTSGGSQNVATIPVRGDINHPSVSIMISH